MKTRADLQSKLEELLGSRNVYYQPPVNLEMKYPAIVYSRSEIRTIRADNSIYRTQNQYELIVIDKKPDNPVIQKLLELPYCRYDRPYKSENLYHDVFTLYY